MDDVTGARWSTKPAAVAAAAALGVVALALTLLTSDAPGRLLLGLATAGLVGAAALGALLRPRLHADHAGLRVRGPIGATALAWPEVADVAVVRTRRLGREVPVLEITGTGEHGVLLVLTRLDLGAEPDDVLPRLRELRAAGA